MTSFTEDDAQTLVKLGLTYSQAKIYLALLVLGAADVKKIAQVAEIDRGEVYRQTEILQKNALLEKIIDIPNRFKAIALDEAIKVLINQKNRENEEIARKAKSLLEKKVITDEFFHNDYKISIIPSDYSKRKLPNRYEYLQKEEVWYTQIEFVPLAINLWDKTFKKAFARGIKLRAIAELNKPTEAIRNLVDTYAKENPNFIIKFDSPKLFTSFAIYDRTEMTMYADRNTGVNERPVLSTTNPILIDIFKDYFELRWKNARTNINW